MSPDFESEPGNPYAPPKAAIAAREAAIDLAIFADAGKGKRFLNWMIDRIACFGLTLVAGVGIGLLHAAGIRAPYELLMATEKLGEYAIGYFVAVIYYILMEGAFGLTLGKLITGTRVVNGIGMKPGWRAIIGRSFARIVPFDPFSFLGNDGGWHDRWSETRVVDIRNRMARLSPGLRKIYGPRY